MVGVAGKSPACHNCRRRRVKCSGEKPGCRNCIRAKLLCTGYQRERVFVFSKHSDPESAPGEDKAVSISKANEPAGRPGVSGPALRRAPVSTVRPVPTVPLAISGRHAYRQQLLGRYLCHYLPAEVVEHGGRPNTKQRNWLLYIPDLPDMSPALEAAVLASCAAKLGHMDRHRGLERESVSQYNKSLAELQKALRHPALRFQDQTLTACLALLMFEFSECPGGQVGGYLSHYWGAMELMHRRGAWAHASGLSNSVFRSLRLHSVFRGFQQRKPSFLAEPDWLELPWAFSTRDSHDQLIDILLKSPIVFVDLDAVQHETCRHKVLAALLRSIRESWRVDAELDAWFAALEGSVSGSLYWPVFARIKTPADDGEQGQLFPVAFRFPSLIIAHTLVLYWTAAVILRQYLCYLYQRVEELVGDTEALGAAPCTCVLDGQGANPEVATADGPTACLRHFKKHELPPLRHRKDWTKTVARDLCQSVEYFLEDSMRCLGPAAILPSLMAVGWLLEHEPGDWARELTWVNYMMGLVQRKGNEIAGCTESQLDEYRGIAAGWQL